MTPASARLHSTDGRKYRHSSVRRGRRKIACGMRHATAYDHVCPAGAPAQGTDRNTAPTPPRRPVISCPLPGVDDGPVRPGSPRLGLPHACHGGQGRSQASVNVVCMRRRHRPVLVNNFLLDGLQQAPGCCVGHAHVADLARHARVAGARHRPGCGLAPGVIVWTYTSARHPWYASTSSRRAHRDDRVTASMPAAGPYRQTATAGVLSTCPWCKKRRNWVGTAATAVTIQTKAATAVSPVVT